MLASGLPLETPSRILRRINAADALEDSLDLGLPSLPNSSSSSSSHFDPSASLGVGTSKHRPQHTFDVGIESRWEPQREQTPETTGKVLEISTQQRMLGRKKPLTPHPQTPVPTTHDDQSKVTSPYTSTPASVQHHHDSQLHSINASSAAGASSMKSGGGTTIRPPLSSRSRSQLVEELSLNEIHAGSEIPHDQALDRDEMVVVSGSGTESDSPSLPQPRPKTRPPNGYKPSPLSQQRHAAGSKNEQVDDSMFHVDSESPSKRSLGQIDLDDLDDLDSDLDVNDVKQAKPQRLDSPSPTQLPTRSGSPTARVTDQRQRNRSRSRTRDGDSLKSYLTSPGIGRRNPTSQPASPVSMDHFSDSESQHGKVMTPQQSHFTTPRAQRLDLANEQPDLDEDNPSSNSAERETRAALEKRKAHLLSTLRLTAVRSATKSKFAKGTPFARRIKRVGGVLSGEPSGWENSIDGQVDLGASIDSAASYESDSTQHDLTTYPTGSRHANGNTSIPLAVEAGQGVSGTGMGASRFNGAKLNAYLHTLNTHLTDENQSLIKTLGETHKEVDRLQSELRSMSESSDDQDGSNPKRSHHQAPSKVLNQHIHELLDSHKNIVSLQHQVRIASGSQQPSSDNTNSSSFTKLQGQVDRFKSTVDERDEEIRELRQQLLKSQQRSAETIKDVETRHLVQNLQNELHHLQDTLIVVEKERDERDREISEMKVDAIESSGQQVELQSHLNLLQNELEQKQTLLQEAQHEIEVQREEFAGKMQTLKSELCKVMDEESQRLNDAEAKCEQMKLQVKKRNVEVERQVEQYERRGSELLQQIEHLTLEKRDLQSAFDAKTKESTSDLRVEQLQNQMNRCEQVINEKERHIQDLMTNSKHVIDQHNEEISTLQLKLSEAQRLVTESKQQVVDGQVNEKQIEEVLDESEKQILAFTKEMANLVAQIDVAESTISAQNVNINGLEERLSQALKSKLSSSTKSTPSRHFKTSNRMLHSTLAKTPQDAEAFSNLEEELNVAYQEIERLKTCLASDEAIASSEIQELKIQMLETHKVDLQDRVTALRRQSLANASPKTPGRSVMFKSLLSVKTPKTPGAMLADMTPFSPFSPGPDGTISPLLAQIHALEQQVYDLQDHLEQANSRVDEKLGKLEHAGLTTVKLVEQLHSATLKISSLELQLNTLLGKGGVILRVQKRLSKIHCPDCFTPFNANDIVRFRVRTDSPGLDLDDEPSNNERESIVNAMNEIRKELTVVKSDNSGKQVEIEKLIRQLHEYEADLAQLAEEKNREQMQRTSNQEELARTKSNLNQLGIDLRSEKTRVRECKQQLDEQAEDLATLRETLEEKGGEIIRLRDERDDILRGVSSLNQELKQLKVTSKSQKSENNQREIDQGEHLHRVGKELEQCRRELASMTQQRKISSVNDALLQDSNTQHALQCKGLLLRIRYLKHCIGREQLLRHQLVFQKIWISNQLDDAISQNESVQVTLANFGLPCSIKTRSSVGEGRVKSFKVVALAVKSVCRMRILAANWRRERQVRDNLRSAYRDLRGKDLPDV